MAGGFTYAANKNIEVARLVQYGDKVENNQVTQIFKTEINGDNESYLFEVINK
jgi:hypothetical protein